MILSDSAESPITEVRDFREAFHELLTKTPFKSLVILVDDLDRCSPERIVENLEAIKLFLNVGNTAFVIGADSRIVRHAIAVRYKQAMEAARAASTPGENAAEAAEQLVRDYVEKLIQVPYHLPRLSPAEIETYMTLLFAKRDLCKESFSLCLAECERQRTENRFRTFGLSDVEHALRGKEFPPQLRSALSFTAGAAHLVTENLNGNPRQVKRFLNAFTLRWKLAKVAKMETLREAVLLKLMLLEYANESRFADLAKWHQQQRATPKELIAMEAGKDFPPDWDKESVRHWLELDPKLSDVDLSDYFWLARDRLASSQIGLTLLPPVVKNAYAALLSETGRKQVPATLKTLRPNEVDSLLSLLKKHLQRDPKDSEGYQAHLTLVQHIPTSFLAFANLIRELPVHDLPAWLPLRIQLLSKNSCCPKDQIESISDYLKAQNDGRSAKAAKLKPKA